MAIQAQYTSPVLFLNRDQQERKNTEYPFQAPAGALLDRSALLFPTLPSNNEGSSGTNRKRRREPATATVPAPMTNYPIDVFSLQQRPPNPSNPSTIATPTTMNNTLIDLSLLRNQQPPASTFVSTGLRLSFEDTQHPNRPNLLQQQQQQQQRQLGQRNSLLSTLMTEELAILVKQQSDEINIYLQAQAEQLQQTLAESRRRHYKALLELAEQSAAKRLREKDVEMEHAARRHAELEKRIVQLRAEAASWQAKARAEEATAAALQAQLQQTALERHLKGTGEPGCSGVADQATAEAEDAESAYVDPERREGAAVGETPGGVSTAMACRVCQRRAVSVLLLPCRHLCLCRDCVAGVEACPICLCARTACLEVFLS